MAPCLKVAASQNGPANHKALDFARDVRPILSNRCFKCHGPDEKTRKGDLRLDVREAALGVGESGIAAIVPGKPSDSELVRRLHADDPSERMPPPSAKMEMSQEEIRILEQWINEGAEYRPHWAFIAPVKSSKASSIDGFIQLRLAEEGLKPSPQANKYQLIRRVSLDLIGLPPTPEEIANFVNDISPDAYGKLVDRLLASPHYGERWARRWLDLARYADTNGYEKDRERQIWPWRDWVIRAFNADMPFDEFTIKQLAGDMLPNRSRDDLVATGFHRNSMLNEEGGIDPLEFRYHAMADRLATTGTTWLGLTLNCAQCHTHKYDPILQSEYFGLMAFLNNADEISLDLPDDNFKQDQAKRYKQAESLIAKLPERWPIPLPSEADWKITEPKMVTTQSGEVPQVLPDHSILLKTKGQEKDTYELTFKFNPQGANLIRVEAMADPAIVSGGPGRTGHGNFVLSEIELYTRPVDIDAKWQRIHFTKAVSATEQPGFPVANAIDQDPSTGWAVQIEGGSHKQNRSAIFHLNGPLPDTPQEYKIRLVQNYGTHHTIGRARISFGIGKPPIPEAILANQRRTALESAFEKWIAKMRNETVEWIPLNPVKLESNEPILTVEPDHVIFVSGDTTKDDHFTLTFNNIPAGATQLRLETLTDSRLPGFGPGRVYYEGKAGDFFLYQLSMEADGKSITFADASSTVGDAKLAVDDSNLTGWTIRDGLGSDQTAVFQLAEPLSATSKLVIKLDMGRYYASTLGKFRLSLSPSSTKVAARVLPKHLEEALGRQQLTSSERDQLMRHFLLNAPQLSEATKSIKELLKPLTPQRTLIFQERSDHPRITRLHKRGEFSQPAEIIQPHLPAFLPQLPANQPANRLSFAQWLGSSQNPLTARVAVNRYWQAFFGTGLVRTVDDFGLQGEAPSHPELLDWLAVTFMENGWSIKQLHRLIVTSETYKQDSRVSPELLKRDPDNRLLARGPRQRLEAELIRDFALEAAGLLSRKLHGPPVRPPQPGSVTEGAYGGMSWQISSGADRYRRGLYTFTKRSAPYASFQTFDAPTGEACLARREVSNTPLQSLVLLNDEVFFEAAQHFGKLIAAHPGTLEDKVTFAFQRCLTRPPSPEEAAKMSYFYQKQLQRLESGELDLKVLMPPQSSREEAAWMTLARVLLNLEEAITKS